MFYEFALASYPTGWYLKCLNLNSCPTKIMACSTPIPFIQSLRSGVELTTQSTPPLDTLPEGE